MFSDALVMNTLNGLIALQRNPVQDAAEAMIVVHGIVLCATVVPKCDCSWLPRPSAGELRLDLMLKQKGQQGCAFLVC